ncbi:MAG TPA: transglutaminase-like domain-containing protein [Mycobacteriales bacterium]|nr:transglutaminase-like domain-containing protein [Mycobacteriales bacterium]
MTAATRAAFAETMRSDSPDLGLACLLIGAEVFPDLDVPASLAALDALAAEAGEHLGEEPAHGLRQALADHAGFRGYGDDYGDLRASLLHEVLRRRRGLPILLSVVYLEVARRLALPAAGIGLPGHFVVEVAGQLVDPFYGGRLVSRPELAARLGSPLSDDDFEPWEVPSIVSRVLANIRAGARGHGTNARTRLWAVELSMLVPSHSVLLRRERGEILIQLGDYLAAAFELEAYAEAVAPVDPESADLALRAARMSRARLS